MFVANLILSSLVISFCAWLSKRRPDLAGFIVSLPLSTLLVLALGQLQSGDSERGIVLAKSIFVAVPSTLLFFIPFLLAGKLKIPFWTAYVSGIALLGVAFFVHRALFTWLTR